MFESLEYLEILHFEDSRSNKVWGRFRTADNLWVVFWCGWHGSSSFKNHGAAWDGLLSSGKARDGKLKKGYKTVDVGKVLEEWPNFETMMNERFVWHCLQSSII